jgi:hypothetical protein
VASLVAGVFFMAVSMPAGLAAAPRAAAADGHSRSVIGRTVRVVPCPTGFAEANPQLPELPLVIKVLHAPSSVRGLAAYTNTNDYLIGPAGMNCSGGIGADGSGLLTIWPRGTRKPSSGSRSDGLSLERETACTSCMADLACPFFPVFAVKTSGFPCWTHTTRGELVVRANAHVALFEDPPGVAGVGFPSGGPHSANGVVQLSSHNGVSRATCTLPRSQRWVCAVSLNDAIARYH